MFPVFLGPRVLLAWVTSPDPEVLYPDRCIAVLLAWPAFAGQTPPLSISHCWTTVPPLLDPPCPSRSHSVPPTLLSRRMFKGDYNYYFANTIFRTQGQGDLAVDTRKGAHFSGQ